MIFWSFIKPVFSLCSVSLLVFVEPKLLDCSLVADLWRSRMAGVEEEMVWKKIKLTKLSVIARDE